MVMTVEQCRAARALLNWSTNDLAAAAKLGLATVRRFETNQPVREKSVQDMADVLIAAGVDLIADGAKSAGGGAGVRMR